MAISSASLTLSFTPILRPSSPSLSFSSSNSSFLNNTINILIQEQNRAGRNLALARTKNRRGLSCNCLFGLGVPELVVIAGVAALVFGPKKLPEVGRSIGKTVKSFQQGDVYPVEPTDDFSFKHVLDAHWGVLNDEDGEDLDFAYDSISAFSTRRDNQDAIFGAEGLKDIRKGKLHGNKDNDWVRWRMIYMFRTWPKHGG